MLGLINPGDEVILAVNGVALCGTLAVQLFFEWLGDNLGRKRVYGITFWLMMICSIALGLSFGSSPKAMMRILFFQVLSWFWY